jgi:hypothetical protein
MQLNIPSEVHAPDCEPTVPVEPEPVDEAGCADATGETAAELAGVATGETAAELAGVATGVGSAATADADVVAKTPPGIAADV